MFVCVQKGGDGAYVNTYKQQPQNRRGLVGGIPREWKQCLASPRQTCPPSKSIGAVISVFLRLLNHLPCAFQTFNRTPSLRHVSPHDLWHFHHIHRKTCLKHGSRDLKAPLRSDLSTGTAGVGLLLSPPQRSQIFACCAGPWFRHHFPLAAAAVPAAATTRLRQVILAIGAGFVVFVSSRRRARGTSHPTSSLSALWRLLDVGGSRKSNGPTDDNASFCLLALFGRPSPFFFFFFNIQRGAQVTTIHRHLTSS